MALPSFIVMSVPMYSGYTYVRRNDDGSAVVGEDSMFSPLVKIELERATTNDKYVHIRFCYNNKYWQKSDGDDGIVALSSKPEEDTTKPSCTLFEVALLMPTLGNFTHVPTGRRVMMNNATKALYVDKAGSEGALLGYMDWSTLVKLPTHVAFKGDNEKYLQAFYDDHNYLKFKSDDPNYYLCSNTVSLMNDGHVRIKNDHWGMFWRRSPNWIWADSTDLTANNNDTLFWPVKIDADTIALRSAGNNRFCQRLTTDGMESCLNAASSTMAKEARLQVQELVEARSINNVRYRMEDARIYGETPYLAGTSSVTNDGDEESSLSVSITYTDEKSYSFSSSLAITAGVTTSIKTGVPFIAEGKVEISFQVETTFEWSKSTTTTTSITATGSVPVPPRSKAVVSYVGTKGTCDVPFSYTQQDRSSTDGTITDTDQIDGVYNGVNCYNFSFIVEKTQPLV
ncbi:uncharacterized protein LOC130992511 [Salvia miltiorrhiza]|uniref:uncharacterized protein LOC130992511 n=1 Tax=Salvia miltiorrhiza TaxID=226208 RepID=UPI0025AB75AC|nr:uncharacterized protein LOC130992511 [Salvia miltiorrhiza]